MPYSRHRPGGGLFTLVEEEHGDVFSQVRLSRIERREGGAISRRYLNYESDVA